MAKPPTSLLYLANHWLGGYEQCRAMKPPTKYDGKPPGTLYTKIIFYLMPNNYFATGVSIDYGACVPDVCTKLDVFSIGYLLISIGAKKIPILSKFRIIGIEMLPKEKPPFSTAAIAMICVTAIFGFIMIVGTIYDLIRVQKIFNKIQSPTVQVSPEDGSYTPVNNLYEDENQFRDTNGLVPEEPQITEPTTLRIWEKMIIAFSIYSNILKILETKQQKGRLNCLDGIRFLSMTWVILGHTFVFSVYFVNNLGYIYPHIMKQWTNAAIYNATFSVDSFFVLSGLLTAFMFLKETGRIGIKSAKLWILYFLHRYWRLTPPYMLFLGFYTALGIYMSSGPFWTYMPDYFLDHKHCATDWWKNLLYINNLYKMNETCMGWSWYLANDMQFHFIVAPVVLICMHLFGVWGCISTIPVLLGSIIATGIIAYKDKKATILDMNENVYFKPWCRVSTYLVGLVVGCVIHEYQKSNRRLPRISVAIGWLMTAGIMLATLYGVAGVVDGSYTESKGVSAFYTATSRFAWSLGLGWLIFACVTGHGGWINSILSWRAFIPLSRLTYCAYLVHPVIIFLFLMSQSSSIFVTTLTLALMFCGFAVISYLTALILSITWESPLIGIERILLRGQ